MSHPRHERNNNLPRILPRRSRAAILARCLLHVIWIMRAQHAWRFARASRRWRILTTSCIISTSSISPRNLSDTCFILCLSGETDDETKYSNLCVSLLSRSSHARTFERGRFPQASRLATSSIAYSPTLTV